jgi:hypothetical protein
MSETVVSIVVSVDGLSGCKSTIHVMLMGKGYIGIPLQLGQLHLIY